MLTDLILAILHHLLMFALVAILVAEIMLLRPEITDAQVRRIAALDVAYGTAAGLILVIGFARVFFGLKGAEYYLTNHAFWAKIAAFLVVGLLSIPPTLRILKWRERLRQEERFTPDTGEVAAIRRFMHWEAAVFVLIPIFAAMMARGYGS